jgi:uracil-DNA glycosylase
MRDELGHPVPDNGFLMPWAEQGVLLLNAVLTVRSGEANSHKGKGWETFTDAVIRAVADRADPAVFVLWGNYAKKKLPLIDGGRHAVVQGAHPSPLSAKKFFGSRPFSQIDAAIASQGHTVCLNGNIGPARPPVPGGFRPGAGERGGASA